MKNNCPNYFSLPFLIFILSLSSIRAQDLPYKFSEDILSKNNSNKNTFALQLAATDFAFQGNYNKALTTWNEQRPDIQEIKLTPFDSAFFYNSKIVPAKDYIIERSKNEEIIILNELHHNASHRLFATSLLKELYANGYRYLGLEALNDLMINERKFATLESGFYTSEPNFGNLIQEALYLGFTVFGYEATNEASWDKDPWKNREIAQAQNIFSYMKENTNGKYFIYCGAGHAFEGNNNGRGYSMAGILAELTGKNPFTIDQNRYSDKGDKRYNQPLSKLINTKSPSVMINSNEIVFKGNSSSYETDISIIQPTNYFENSIQKLQNSKEYSELIFPNKAVKLYPAIILIYRKGEFDKNGVPAAVYEIESDTTYPSIYLKKYTYEIIILDRSYAIQNKFDLDNYNK